MSITKSFLSEYRGEYTERKSFRDPAITVRKTLLDIISNYSTDYYKFDAQDRLTYLQDDEFGYAYTKVFYKNNGHKGIEIHNSEELYHYEFNENNILVKKEINRKNWDGRGNYTLSPIFTYLQVFDNYERVIQQSVNTHKTGMTGNYEIEYNNSTNRISKVIYNKNIKIDFIFKDEENKLEINASNGYKEVRLFNLNGKIISRQIFKNKVLLTTITFTYNDNNSLLLREQKVEGESPYYFKLEYKYDSWNRHTEVEAFSKHYQYTYPDGDSSFINTSTKKIYEYTNDSVAIRTKRYEIATIEHKDKCFFYNKLDESNSTMEEFYEIPELFLNQNGAIVKNGFKNKNGTRQTYKFTLLKDFLLLDVNEAYLRLDCAEEVKFFKIDDFYMCAIGKLDYKMFVNDVYYSIKPLTIDLLSDVHLNSNYHYLFEEIDIQMYRKDIAKSNDNGSQYDYLDFRSVWDEYDEDGVPYNDYEKDLY
ncbi:hypothetical protein ACTQ5K_02050 [Niallia sp. Sow4_A1]|uniref:hypothetical protein n=1 Tax=Niallia sp. Sow4_A1 TaxID=3438793 RepID=UPI003F9721B7